MSRGVFAFARAECAWVIEREEDGFELQDMLPVSSYVGKVARVLGRDFNIDSAHLSKWSAIVF